MQKIKRIQVVCPAGAITGGPESLHNLVGVINSLGVAASIVYYPFGQTWSTPIPYQHYRVEISALNDTADTLVIFPEVLPMEALRLRKAKVAIWWLSLDNFRERKYHSRRDSFRYLIRVLQGRRPIAGVAVLRKLLHFSKCYYDESYLLAHKITPMRLTGPIGRFYLSNSQRGNPTPRKNRILCNARKGKTTLQLLMARCPQYDFTALDNLDEQSLLARYQENKLYVDFGHHPGPERMPREAVVCGCCVITGKLGAAANPFDVPIPDRFKLDQRDKRFPEKFATLVEHVFTNFDAVSPEFEAYRQQVCAEPIRQREDLEKILAVVC